MKTILTGIFFILALAVPAAAQEPTPAWASGRNVADVVSTGTVAAQIGLETWSAWRAADRRRALTREGLRLGVTVGLSEITKRLVHRTRPDGSDRLSFFSEHTAIAAAASGWQVEASIPLTFSAGYFRMAADKHHPSDVIVGAVVGGLMARWLR